MTKRERTLVLATGLTLLCGGLAAVVRYGIVQPFGRVAQETAAARAAAQMLEAQLAALDTAPADWTALTGKTLAVDAPTAQVAFQRQLQTLLVRHGLLSGATPQDTKISPGQPTTDRRGFTRVPLTVSAAGTLDDIVGFLCDFYRQDYIARLEQVHIRADASLVSDVNRPQRGRRSRSAEAEPLLTLNLTAATVVLPTVAGVPVQAGQELRVAELPQGRLRSPAAAYAAIVEQNLFVPWQPAEIGPPSGPTGSAAIAVDPNEAVEPPGADEQIVAQRDPAAEHVVRYVGRIAEAPSALVYDPRDPASAPQRYHPDDDFHDGTLLLIHRAGLVVRVLAGDTVRDYFYPLGRSFAQRELLDPERHPEVWRALLEEFPAAQRSALPPLGDRRAT